MKKHTKLLSMLLAVLMLMSFVPLTAFAETTTVDSGTCGENLTWTLDDEGTLIISGTGDMYDYNYNESPFNFNNYIINVVIENGVASIDKEVFSHCHSLTSITVDENNNNYSNDEYGVLFNKDKTTLIQYPIGSERTSYTIPDSVTSISKESFYNCKLTSITIPNSVTNIGKESFSYCNLTSITIPDSVTSIDEEAFYFCPSLTSIIIPDSVTSIGNAAFALCINLASITVDENNNNYSNDEYGVLFNKDKTTLIQYPVVNARTTYKIPNSVTNIGNFAFAGGLNLTNITIPDSVTNIGDYAFCYCSNITRLTIPDNITSIGECAFAYCNKLTSVTIPDSVTSIGEGAFVYNSFTSITIPDSVTIINENTFAYCEKLTSITIPNSITSIERNAFGECDKLTDVYYCGSEEEWNAIDIDLDDERNKSLLNATIHFNHCTHPNKDGNGICDNCGILLEDCTCACHNNSGFIAFIWKILRFIYMIFGTNPVCECGIAHY